MSIAQTVVLVVDDEESLRNFVRRNLEVRKYRVFTAANGLEALAHFSTQLIIRRIRQSSQVPIIVLSALGEEEDKIRALKLGADDYLTKPFGVGELLARLQAVLRRTRWIPRTVETAKRLLHHELAVDLERHAVTLNSQPIELTPIEFELLVYLMENTGKVLTHRAILQHVWGEEYGQETEYLRVYIGRLRQKIEADPTSPRYLLTERGIGYLFAGR
jgi:two-component system, OmpR family, KDP operon response regulator KdpE